MWSSYSKSAGAPDPKRLDLKRYAAALAGVLLAGAAATAWYSQDGYGQAAHTAPQLSRPIAAAPPVAPVPQPPATGDAFARQPQRLLVPAATIDAKVETLGKDAAGRIATPTNIEDVGWYQLGPGPGEPGNAIIDGHLDWYTGPAVFWHLQDLKAGDEIRVVRSDGSSLSFLVDSTRKLATESDASDLFTAQGEPQLTLITCAGQWDRGRQTYNERLLVHARLAHPAA